MDNSSLANNFSDGATKGKGSHLFIDGDTIYSYGYHFPIAKRLGVGRYLFNANDYSPTTRQHKNLVLNALGNSTIIHVRRCDDGNAKIQIEANKEEIEYINKKLKKSRSENVISSYENKIEFLEEQNNLLGDLK